VLNKIFDLAPPLLIGAAVDVVVRREDSLFARWGVVDVRHQLWLLAGLTLAIWILESVFEYLNRILWRNAAQAIQHELRLEAYEHVQGLDAAWLDERGTGAVIAVLNDDVSPIERFLDGGSTRHPVRRPRSMTSIPSAWRGSSARRARCAASR
jgi:ATP-binding cassette subfamily B protein